MKSYIYHTQFQATWGIWIHLLFDIEPSEKPTLEIGPQWIKNTTYPGHLQKALDISGQSIKVTIYDIEYNPTDFQEEGLTPALAEAIAKETGRPIPEFCVGFDKAKRKYIFKL